MAIHPIFENDKDGKVLHGSKADLIAAISAGFSIRICIIADDEEGHLVSFVPSSLVVRRGHVFAQFMSIGGDWKVGEEDILDFVQPLIHIVQNFSTSGKVINVFTTASGETRSVYQNRLKWYVDG